MCGAGANSSCRTRWRFKAFYAKNGGTKWTRKARVLTPRAGLLQISRWPLSFLGHPLP
jgi:hypothetical protein